MTFPLSLCLLQKEFISLVTLELENKKKVKTRIRAQWASEYTMLEVLKLPPKLGCFDDCSNNILCDLRARVKAIKEFCDKNLNHTK